MAEWLETLPEIENDSAIDGDLGKRLNQLGQPFIRLLMVKWRKG